MSSSTDPSDSILNVESSELTRITSSGAIDMSGSDHTVDPKSDCLSYDWVDPWVLDVPTCYRGPNDWDKFLSKVSIFKPDSPLDAVVAESYGHTDRVWHGWESTPQDFFFVHNTFFKDLHVILPFDECTMGVVRILNVAST